MTFTELFAELYSLEMEVQSEREKSSLQKEYALTFTASAESIRAQLFEHDGEACEITASACFLEGTAKEDFGKFRAEVQKIVFGEPIRRMTHAEIFQALRDGAVVKRTKVGQIMNWWSTSQEGKDWLLCRHYTGTDADVWEKMETGE